MYVCYHICHAMPSYHVIVYYTEFILSSIFICYTIYSVMYYYTLQICHAKYVVCYMLCHVTKCYYLKLVMYLTTIVMRKIHGATTTVEYVFLMLSQVCVEYMGPQQLWSMYLHVEYMGPQQLWSMYFSC